MDYDKLVRKLRQRIYDYEHQGKGKKASRVLREAIKRKVALYPDKTPHSGLVIGCTCLGCSLLRIG